MKEDSGFANRFVSTLPGADESTKSGSESGRAESALMVAASALPPRPGFLSTTRAAWLMDSRSSFKPSGATRATWALTSAAASRAAGEP